MTPGHPLFESVRVHTLSESSSSFAEGACFYSLGHDAPARLDFYRSQVVDGLGDVIHERLFAVEYSDGQSPALREPGVLGNLQPVPPVESPPNIVPAEDVEDWLHRSVLAPFVDEVRAERVQEVERISQHVELSLGELIQREDEKIGRFAEMAERGDDGAAGNLRQAEDRQSDLIRRRDRRRQELSRQRSLTLQNVERITGVLVLPHPEREAPDLRNLRPDAETEAIAMRVVIEHEQQAGRVVTDVHEKNLGYDVTSLDTNSGEIRLIEVKGIAGSTGTICLTPNEKRVAEDRRDCYWLYVVTDCKTEPNLHEPIFDPTRLAWHEIQKVDHYRLSVGSMGGAAGA